MRCWQVVTLAIGSIAAAAGCSASSTSSGAGARLAPPVFAQTQLPELHVSPTAMLPKDRWPTGHAYVLHPEPDAERGRIYSSSDSAGSLTYYIKGTGPNNPVAGKLSGSLANPQGMAVDKAGNLYVSNGNDTNVLIYPSGARRPSSTLTDPNEFPDDVAIGSDGTVYVANIFAPVGNPGSISVYAPGASSPTNVLNDSAFVEVVGVALDKAGNVFVSYDQTYGAHGTVVEFPAGSSNPVATKIAVGAAGGIGFDQAGHMLLVDQVAPSLNIYEAGKSKPLAKLPLPGAPIYFCFGKHSNIIYLADYTLGEIDVFRYTPTGLTLINKITNGIVPSNNNTGVAITSPQE
jgi:hypothetical protein